MDSITFRRPQWSLHVLLLSHVSIASLDTGTCSVDKGCGGCTLARVEDGSNKVAIGEVFANGAISEPIMFRGASKYWPVTKKAAEDIESLTDMLKKKYGKEPMLFETSARVAQFGGAKTHFSQNFTLEKYLKEIETRTGVYIAFQANSDLGAKLAGDGLYDLKFQGTFTSPKTNKKRNTNQKQKEFTREPVTSFGGDGDGLPFHTHGEAVLGLVTGTKQWMLMAPEDMTEAVLAGSFNVTYYLDQLLSTELNAWPKGMHYCEQLPGDVLFVPFNWWHATRNVGFTIGLGGHNNEVDENSYALDANKSNSVPDLELDSRMKLRSNDPTVAAEGVAGLMDAYQQLPSKLSLAYHLVAFLANENQNIVATAQIKRVHRHLLSLEARGTIESKSLAALMAHVGEQAVNSVRDMDSGLALLDDSMRLDDLQPGVWHNSGYALFMLSEDKLAARGIQEKDRKDIAVKYLWKALELDPSYKPSIDALKQLGEI